MFQVVLAQLQALLGALGIAGGIPGAKVTRRAWLGIAGDIPGAQAPLFPYVLGWALLGTKNLEGVRKKCFERALEMQRSFSFNKWNEEASLSPEQEYETWKALAREGGCRLQFHGDRPDEHYNAEDCLQRALKIHQERVHPGVDKCDECDNLVA